MPLRAIRTTLRQKLQATLGLLILVVLGLSAVMMWATIHWRRSEAELREHYLRSLLLLEVRAGTFRAFKELPDAAFAGDLDAANEFEHQLSEVERDFGTWAALAHVDGSLLGIAYVAKDVSERKRAEDQLRSALEEKEVLFKEINHRVKNNLQIILSLLNLHARQTGDVTAREILRDSQNRLQAMALVHEMLYRSETPAHIDLGDYLRNLATHLMGAHGTASHRIRVESGVERLASSLDTAIPCGLIVSELVTNSLKHGFPGASAGDILIELSEVPGQRRRVTVRDNGVGLPEPMPQMTGSSLGLRLVNSLVEQLGGVLTCRNEAGAVVEFDFPSAYPT